MVVSTRAIARSGTRQEFRPRCSLRMNLVLTCCCMAMIGCGSQGFDVAPVTGKVTLDGKPVGGLVVNFQPSAKEGGLEPGPGAYAWTDEGGRFTLALISEKKQAGAVVGKGRVTLSSPLPDQKPDDDRIPKGVKSLLPPEHEGKSFEFEVPAKGTDKADFTLTTGGTKR